MISTAATGDSKDGYASGENWKSQTAWRYTSEKPLVKVKVKYSCWIKLPENLIYFRFLKLFYLYAVEFCVKTSASDAETWLLAFYATRTGEYRLVRKT